MDTINSEWLVRCNTLADKAEDDYTVLHEMTDTELSYLVYWNWGYSGTIMAEVTREAIKVLTARGVDYNTLGEQVDLFFEQNSHLLD